MSEDAKRILIIEDNEEIVESITLVLHIKWSNITIDSTYKGEDGLLMLERDNYDLVILDLGLPDISGFEVLKSIRLFSNIPVVILTAKGEEESIVKGLELGACEYIVKPFRRLEFIARINNILRQRESNTKDCVPIVNGPFTFYPHEEKLTFKETEIDLTRTESIIMEKLIANAGHVISHSQMSEAIWGDYYKDYYPMLKTYIQRLRKKIENDPNNPSFILTKHGLGYCMAKISELY
jgi:two-component system KDP operon response regulator KdpE